LYTVQTQGKSTKMLICPKLSKDGQVAKCIPQPFQQRNLLQESIRDGETFWNI